MIWHVILWGILLNPPPNFCFPKELLIYVYFLFLTYIIILYIYWP